MFYKDALKLSVSKCMKMYVTVLDKLFLWDFAEPEHKFVYFVFNKTLELYKSHLQSSQNATRN